MHSTKLKTYFSKLIRFMKFDKLRKKLLFLTSLILLLILILFTLINSYPVNSYKTVANRWFENYSISPPLDIEDKKIREVKIDFIAPKEFDTKINSDFYWITNSGDLLTITNPNFVDLEITLNFDLKTDPCNQERSVVITTEREPIFVSLEPQQQLNIKIPLKIRANKSIFLTISPNDKLLCRLNSSDNRLFLAQIINPIINYQ